MARPTTASGVAALRQGFGFGLWGHGAVSITAEQSRSNTAFGVLGTPDVVADVVVPSNGLVLLGYQATWKESVNGAATAAIFTDSDQLKIANATTGAPVVQEASHACGTTDTYKPLASYQLGLASLMKADATNYTGDVTTGQALGRYSPAAVLAGFELLGGFVVIQGLPAGTYDFGVQFKAATGSVTVKNRKLWVASIGFE